MKSNCNIDNVFGNQLIYLLNYSRRLRHVTITFSGAIIFNFTDLAKIQNEMFKKDIAKLFEMKNGLLLFLNESCEKFEQILFAFKRSIKQDVLTSQIIKGKLNNCPVQKVFRQLF